MFDELHIKIFSYYNFFKHYYNKKILSYILMIPKIYFYDEVMDIVYYHLPLHELYIETLNKNDLYYFNRTFNAKNFYHFMIKRTKKIEFYLKLNNKKI